MGGGVEQEHPSSALQAGDSPNSPVGGMVLAKGKRTALVTFLGLPLHRHECDPCKCAQTALTVLGACLRKTLPLVFLRQTTCIFLLQKLILSKNSRRLRSGL